MSEQKQLLKKPSLKLTLIGNSGTGKTSLLQRYFIDKFNDNPEKTIGANSFFKTVSLRNGINSIEVDLYVSDTAGNPQDSLSPEESWEGSDAIGIVLTPEKEDLDSVSSYYQRARAALPPETPIFFIVNKVDLFISRTDTTVTNKSLVESIKNTTKEVDPSVSLCSAKTGGGVKAVFDGIAHDIYQYKRLQELGVKNTDSPLKPSQPNSITQFIANHQKWAFANMVLTLAAIIALVILASLPIGALPLLAGVTLLGVAAIATGLVFLILNGICLIGNYLVKKDGGLSSLPDHDNRKPGDTNIEETLSNQNVIPNPDSSFIANQTNRTPPPQITGQQNSSSVPFLEENDPIYKMAIQAKQMLINAMPTKFRALTYGEISSVTGLQEDLNEHLIVRKNKDGKFELHFDNLADTRKPEVIAAAEKGNKARLALGKFVGWREFDTDLWHVIKTFGVEVDMLTYKNEHKDIKIHPHLKAFRFTITPDQIKTIVEFPTRPPQKERSCLTQ